MHPRSFFAVMMAVFAATASMSCIDPVRSDDVAAQGPEREGIPEGPTHRPGQPCRVCHGGDGPGSPEFIIAGTTFTKRGNAGALLPAAGVEIVISDENKNELRRTRSNEVGNFYISTDDWKPGPTFPLFVSLVDPRASNGVKEMNTPIGRNGGCAFCHYGADGEKSHMPPVFLVEK